MSYRTMKAAIDAGRNFAEIVESLRALASDPKADPDEAGKAEAMLRTLKGDATKNDQARNLASSALRRVEDSTALREKMGLRANRPAIRHEGHRSTFGVLTAEDASRHIASKR